MKREFDWLSRFDVLVWSYQLRMAKPDPAIYRHVLAELGTQPAETLFIDDRAVNVQAALALGFQAIEFSSVEKLRADLVAPVWPVSFRSPERAAAVAALFYRCFPK